MIRPLSNNEIAEKTGCKFILYENLAEVGSINKLLPKTLILYHIAKIGHFACIFVNKQGINFFDPIGYKVDQILIKKRYNQYTKNHNFTYLTKLLYNSGNNVIFNEYEYQRPESMVCGYWCATRLIYSHLTNAEFHRIFEPIMKKDNKIVKFYNTL